MSNKRRKLKRSTHEAWEKVKESIGQTRTAISSIAEAQRKCGLEVQMCPVCEGRKTFCFRPRFPSHLQGTAQRLQLTHPKRLPCPFCRQSKELDNLVPPLEADALTTSSCPRRLLQDSKSSKVQIKQEGEATEKNVYGLPLDRLRTVTPNMAAQLILHHGFHPRHALRAIIEHPVNIMDAVAAASHFRARELDEVQMRVLQTVSEETLYVDKRQQGKKVEAAVERGDIHHFWMLFPREMTSWVVHVPLFLEYLCPPPLVWKSQLHQERVESRSLCWALSPVGNLTEADVQNKISLFGEGIGHGHLRVRCSFTECLDGKYALYRMLFLLHQIQRWYGEPARQYCQVFFNAFDRSLKCLQACVDKALRSGACWCSVSCDLRSSSVEDSIIEEETALDGSEPWLTSLENISRDGFRYYVVMRFARYFLEDWINAQYEVRLSRLKPKYGIKYHYRRRKEGETSCAEVFVGESCYGSWSFVVQLHASDMRQYSEITLR